MKAVVLIGIPGSGKSTLADNMILSGYRSVSADRIREALYGDAGIQGDPREVFGTFYRELDSHLTAGNPIVVDNTNVRAKDRKKLLEQFVRFGYTVEYWLMDTPLETCLLRNSLRERKVPDHVILRMFRALQENKAQLDLECDCVVKIAGD